MRGIGVKIKFRPRGTYGAILRLPGTSVGILPNGFDVGKVLNDFTLVQIRISPQSRKGRGEVIFYLAVRGRQIKRPFLQKKRAAYEQNHLFPKGWGL